MELSFTSFILELINFFVLIWILKRLFFMPIKNVINKRKEEIQATLDKAKAIQHEANEMQEKYAGRIQQWEHEKATRWKVVETEINKWKTAEHKKFEDHLAGEEEKIHARSKHYIQENIRQSEKNALVLATNFSSKLLSTFANQGLEANIINKFLSQIDKNMTHYQQMLSEINSYKTIEISSAYDLTKEQRDQITNICKTISGKDIDTNFSLNSNLLAGLSIKMGPISLDANLRDELKFFMETNDGTL